MKTTATPTREIAAIYRRVSTKKQEESLKTQEAKCDQYCAFKDLLILPETEFSDEAKSGSIPLMERPGGKTFFNAVALRVRLKLPPIRHLVVAKLDRLGRSARDLLQTVEALKKLDITLHIVDMNGDTLSTQGPAGRLMFTLLAGMAEFEREMIGGRIRETFERKFEAREVIGHVPYGFDAIGSGRFKAAKSKDALPVEIMELIDNPTEQEWLLKMRNLREIFKMSFHAIAAELNKCGVRTKTGIVGGWQSGNVAKTLSNNHTLRFLDEYDRKQEQEKAA